MKKESRKIAIIFSIIIAIFTIGIVPKTFQNDTFFNISIGKYLLDNRSIDMQEHFSWVQGLTYTYSHWAFDIVTYLIYNTFGFTGIYIGVVIFAIVTNIILFNLLNKRNNSPIIALLITLISIYIIRSAYTARSQIVSFVCFIIEIYAIEKFIETNKKRYGVLLIILSIVIANFHAATWPLYLVLFMPYLGAAFLNLISAKNIYTIMKNRAEKKLRKLPKNSPKVKKYEEDVKDYSKFIEEIKPPRYTKISRRENYNGKALIILLIVISLTGLITPIHGTPYTYIIKSMLGPSNFENNASIDFIAEMQPIVPANSRYVYLLVFLGSYVLVDLLSQCVKEFIPEDMVSLEKICLRPIVIIFFIVFTCVFSTSKYLMRMENQYVDEKLYPVGATEYIKNNLDYKKMRIYNSYNNGSYLMLNDIPIFIDSRLDVYCSEFNDTDVFYDYVQVAQGKQNYEDIFTKNDFTHILIYNDEIIYNYIKNDENYKVLYEDEYFTLYERNVK